MTLETFSFRTDFDRELVPAVERVLNPLGILRENDTEDDGQSLERHKIYTVGPNEETAIPVVLIGSDASGSEDLERDMRPHRLKPMIGE